MWPYLIGAIIGYLVGDVWGLFIGVAIVWVILVIWMLVVGSEKPVSAEDFRQLVERVDALEGRLDDLDRPEQEGPE